ncbi:MAG: diacylglycerol kinase family protein [Candidatus Nanopelagicales bacterium]
MKIAVVAHRKKTFGGGLVELRRVLADLGVNQPMWFEVNKSRKAPAQVSKALAEGAELVFVWGGDGTVQRSIDVLAGSKVPMAVLPAGTANLFATNLGIPQDLTQAVEVGLGGSHRQIDVGRINGECFGVMAGVGADALMIKDADRGLKDRLGRSAYVLTGARALSDAQFKVEVTVDGERFYKGRAGCVLVGNVGKLFGGIEAFDDAKPDDSKLDVGVVTALSALQWSRLLARATVGRTDRSKYVQISTGQKIDIQLKSKLPYELDGGDRPPVKRLKIRVQPKALTVCVPDPVQQ